MTDAMKDATAATEAQNVAQKEKVATTEVDVATTAEQTAAEIEEVAASESQTAADVEGTVALNGKIASMKAYIAEMWAAIPVIGKLAIAIGGIYVVSKVFDKLKETFTTTPEEIKSSIDKINDSVDSNNKQIDSLEELKAKLEEAKGNKIELNKISGDLNKTIGQTPGLLNGESHAYDVANKKIEDRIEALKEQNKEELKNKVNLQKDLYSSNDIKGSLLGMTTYDFDLKDYKNAIETTRKTPQSYDEAKQLINFSYTTGGGLGSILNPSDDEISSYFQSQIKNVQEIFADKINDYKGELSEPIINSILENMVYQGKDLPEISKELDKVLNNDEINKTINKFYNSLNNPKLNTDQLKNQIKKYLDGISSQYPYAKKTITAFYNSLGNDIKSNSKKVNKSFSFQDVWKDSNFSKSKEALLELAKAGELTPEVLKNNKDYADLLKAVGGNAEIAAEKINKMVSSADQLSSMKEGISSISGALTKKKENLSAKNTAQDGVDIDTLSGVPDTVKKCKKEYNQFLEVLGNGKSTMTECKKAADNLATAYVNSNNFLSKLTKGNKDYYISQLKNMGVENAEQIVLDALNNKKAQAIVNTMDLANMTGQEIVQLCNEKGALNGTTQALEVYALKKIYANGNGLNTMSDINQLIALVKGLGYATTALKVYKDAKADMESANNDNLEGMPSQYQAQVKKQIKKRYTTTKSAAASDIQSIVNDMTKIKVAPTTSTSSSGSGGSGKSSSSKSPKTTSTKTKKSESAEQFDFIEQKLKILNDNVDKATNKIDNMFSFKSKDNQIVKAINATTKAIDGELKAAKRYQDYADKMANKATKDRKITQKTTVKTNKDIGTDIVNNAKQYVNKLRYIYGGESLTSGADCSGFTMQIMKQYGVNLDHHAASQYANAKGTRIKDKSKLKKGDLVFFKNSSGIHHVGIYSGNGKFIEERGKKWGTKESTLSTRSDFYGGIRLSGLKPRKDSGTITSTKTTTKTVKGVSLSTLEKYKKRVENGTLSDKGLQSIKNENLKQAINDYKTYYDKAQDAKKAAKDLKEKREQLKKDRLQNHVDNADSQLGKISAKEDNAITATEKNKLEENKMKWIKESYKYQIKIAKLEKDSVKVATLRAQKEKEILEVRKNVLQNSLDQNDAERDYIDAKLANTTTVEGKQALYKDEYKTYESNQKAEDKYHKYDVDKFNTSKETASSAITNVKTISNADMKKISSYIKKGKKIPQKYLDKAKKVDAYLYDRLVSYNNNYADRADITKALKTTKASKKNVSSIEKSIKSGDNISKSVLKSIKKQDPTLYKYAKSWNSNKSKRTSLTSFITKRKGLSKSTEAKINAYVEQGKKIPDSLLKKVKKVDKSLYNKLVSYNKKYADGSDVLKELKSTKLSKKEQDTIKKLLDKGEVISDSELKKVKKKSSKAYKVLKEWNKEKKNRDSVKKYVSNEKTERVKPLTKSEKEKIQSYINKGQKIPQKYLDRVKNVDSSLYKTLVAYNKTANYSDLEKGLKTKNAKKAGTKVIKSIQDAIKAGKKISSSDIKKLKKTDKATAKLAEAWNKQKSSRSKVSTQVSKSTGLTQADRKEIESLAKSGKKIPKSLLDKIKKSNPTLWKTLYDYNQSVDDYDTASLAYNTNTEKNITDKRQSQIDSLQVAADEDSAKIEKNEALQSISTNSKQKNEYINDSINDTKDEYKQLIEIAKLNEDITEQKKLEAEEQSKINDLIKEQFENISTDYDRMIKDIENNIDGLDNKISFIEAKGGYISSDMYKAKADVDKKDLEAAINKAQDLDNQLQNSSIPKYTDQWYEMKDAVYDAYNQADQMATKVAEDFVNAFEAGQDLVQAGIDAIDKLNDEANMYKNVLSHKDFTKRVKVDDDGTITGGELTDEGRATIALTASQMSNVIEKNKELLELVKANNEARDKGIILEKKWAENDANYQQQIASNMEAYYGYIDELKSHIQNLYDAQADALDKMISKYKEISQNESDLRSYQKDIKNQTQSIAKLQKQKDALMSAGNLTEEQKARLQTINVSLKSAKESLEDTEYQKHLEDQEKILDGINKDFQDFIANQMDNTDELIQSIVNKMPNDGSIVYDTISDIASAWETNVSEPLKNQLLSGNYTTINGNIGEATKAAAQVSIDMKSLWEQDSQERTSLLGDNSFINKSLQSIVNNTNAMVTNLQQYCTTSTMSTATANNPLFDMIGSIAKIPLSTIPIKSITSSLFKAGYANGGVVGGDLNRVFSHNGDSLIATVNPRESVLTEEFTNMLPTTVNTMKQFNNLPNTNVPINTNGLVSNSIGNINITLEGANVTNPESFIKTLQTSDKVRKAIQTVTIGQGLGSGKLGINRF